MKYVKSIWAIIVENQKHADMNFKKTNFFVVYQRMVGEDKIKMKKSIFQMQNR